MIPKMLDVKEAVSEYFSNTISESYLYALVKRKMIPHVRLSSGRILFDRDKLTEWWNKELEKSTEKEVVTGLRKIM